MHVAAMNLSRIIKRIWYGPPVISSAAELTAGKAIIEGRVAAAQQGIISPLTSTPCVAYKYRAVYRTPSRTQGVAERLLKEAEVYSPSFDLLLEGGKIRVAAQSREDFDKAAHQELQSGGYRGFEATERLVRAGAMVRAAGKIMKDGGGFFLSMRKLELVQEQGLLPAAGRRAMRKKGKKRR